MDDEKYLSDFQEKAKKEGLPVQFGFYACKVANVPENAKEFFVLLCQVKEQARASAVIDWLESEEATDLFFPAFKEEHGNICNKPMRCVFKNMAAKLRENKK